MKLFLLLPLMLSVLQLSAQQPPKKASVIIVLAKDTSNSLLNKITMVLFDYGYSIEYKDESVKIITTKAKPSNNYGTMSKIKAKITDTSIVFSSMITLNSETDILGVKEAVKTFYTVDYRGSKKSAMREAWNELDAIAKQFGDKIVYSK